MSNSFDPNKFANAAKDYIKENPEKVAVAALEGGEVGAFTNVAAGTMQQAQKDETKTAHTADNAQSSGMSNIPGVGTIINVLSNIPVVGTLVDILKTPLNALDSLANGVKTPVESSVNGLKSPADGLLNSVSQTVNFAPVPKPGSKAQVEDNEVINIGKNF